MPIGLADVLSDAMRKQMNLLQSGLNAVRSAETLDYLMKEWTDMKECKSKEENVELRKSANLAKIREQIAELQEAYEAYAYIIESDSVFQTSEVNQTLWSPVYSELALASEHSFCFEETSRDGVMWIMPLRGKYMVWAITGFLLLGYDQGVMSGIIGADNQFGKDFNHPDPTTQGTIVAIYDIGCAVGSLIVFFYGEAIGRKRMIMSGAATMLVGTAILTSSTTLAQLYVGRVVTGIGNGFNSSSIPVYQSETCGGEVRGKLVSLNSTVTIIGLVIAYWLDFGLSFVDGPAQWRFPIGFQAFFALCLLFQGLVLPDSPRWLIAHGYKDEGARVIAMLENQASTNHPDVVRVTKEIEASLALESAGGKNARFQPLVYGM
ncbi:hypothetical protein C0989_001767 [Termitomyces sp. Mn162]|nr:hypothetical protein C0989_001767 [Termitomyces sp. Mn162]